MIFQSSNQLNQESSNIGEKMELDEGSGCVKMSVDEAKARCKLETGATCCAYLGYNHLGMVCLKRSSLSARIQERIDGGLMHAKGIGDWPECYWQQNC